MNHTPGPLKTEIEMHVDHDVTGYPVFYIHGFSGEQKWDEAALEQYRQQLVIRYNSHDAMVEAVRRLIHHAACTEVMATREPGDYAPISDAEIASAQTRLCESETGSSAMQAALKALALAEGRS